MNILDQQTVNDIVADVKANGQQIGEEINHRMNIYDLTLQRRQQELQGTYNTYRIRSEQFTVRVADTEVATMRRSSHLGMNGWSTWAIPLTASADQTEKVLRLLRATHERENLYSHSG